MRPFITIICLLLTVAATAQPDGADLYKQGYQAANAGKYEEALALYQKLVKRDSAHGKAWYEIGWCYNELEKYEDGLQAMLKAKQLLGDEPEILFEIGYSYQRTGRPHEAQQQYEKCIALKADFAVAHRQLATIHYEDNRDFAAALKHYKEHIRYSDPVNVSSLSWFRKAYCEVEAGDLDAALQSLEHSIAADNSNIEAWNEKGFVFFQQGKADEGIAAYQKSLAIDTLNAPAYKGLGDIYRVLKQETANAYTHYSKAVMLEPSNAINHFSMAWCYNDKNEFEKSVPHLQKAIELNGGEAIYHAELGYTYYGLQKYDLALAALDRSLQLEELSYALYYKGLIHLALRDKKRSREMLEKLKAMRAPEAEALAKKIGDL